jgi:hypothetical protein
VNTKLTKQGVGGKYSYLGKMGEAELAAAQHLVSSSSSPGLELKSFITTESGCHVFADTFPQERVCDHASGMYRRRGIENSSSIFNRLLKLHNPTYPNRITLPLPGWAGMELLTKPVPYMEKQSI